MGPTKRFAWKIEKKRPEETKIIGYILEYLSDYITKNGNVGISIYDLIENYKSGRKITFLSLSKFVKNLKLTNLL
jgi:hypothetical protein